MLNVVGRIKLIKTVIYPKICFGFDFLSYQHQSLPNKFTLFQLCMEKQTS